MKAHRTDLVSFSFGLAFLALAVWWLLARILGLTLPPVGWFLAGALVLIGLLGLVGALRSGRHAHREPTAPEPEATVAAPYLDGTPTTGGPAAAADEWATDAAVDDRGEATEDLPSAGGPHWSPFAPPAGADLTGPPTGPVGATRELPLTGADRTDVEPPTRELPVAEAVAAQDTEPATRELPATEAAGDTDPATRELPATEAGRAGEAGPPPR